MFLLYCISDNANRLQFVYVCFSGKYFKNVKIYTEHINSDDKEEIMFVPDEDQTSSMVS